MVGGSAAAAGRNGSAQKVYSAPHGRPGRRATAGRLMVGHSSSTWQDGQTTVLFDPVLTARLGHLRRFGVQFRPPTLRMRTSS